VGPAVAPRHHAYPNPGGQDVLHPHRRDFLVFHADTSDSRRAMFVVELDWNDPEDRWW
jgi:hypothetical protein